jgi:hypothetical protein
MLHGLSHGAGCCIEQHSFAHWAAPVADAESPEINGRMLHRKRLLQSGDELAWRNVTARFFEPCPGSRSPVLEFTQGSVRVSRDAGVKRVVLFGTGIWIASHPPCHIGLPGLYDEVLELCWFGTHQQLCCCSRDHNSVLATHPAGPRRWIQQVAPPCELFVSFSDIRAVHGAPSAPARLSIQSIGLP